MTEDPEIKALANVYAALKDLDADSQTRIVEYVAKKLGIEPSKSSGKNRRVENSEQTRSEIPEELSDYRNNNDDEEPDTYGISPVAVKWMTRNGLSVDQLGNLFSLGTDEIDLIAQSVPGTSKNARTRSVTILKGIAAYLSTGAARVSAEQIKEACLHYDAYDPPNHAKYLKKMSTELSGNKASGFTLTAKGVGSGTELIKEILGDEEDKSS